MSELDVLYQDTITLFNRYISKDNEYAQETTYWVPTVLTGVHLMLDRAKIISTYGENASDNAMVNIRYTGGRNAPVIQGKKFLQPKEFRKQYLGDLEEYITFSLGDDFDFFVAGRWNGLDDIVGNIDDDVYMNWGGFMNYMNSEYDNVFAITGFSQYNLIPHFTITAR